MAGTPNVGNRTLFHGDNLPFLRGINSESIHLIATDPPFNKNSAFNDTPGVWQQRPNSRTAGAGAKMPTKTGSMRSKMTGPRHGP